MSNTVISVENLTKQYDLGVIGTGTLSRDLNRWWARLRGKPDPYTRIGQEDHFKRRGESILALDDVSFKVEQGEVLGFIGKNGAGKSTLLKILLRVTAPKSGVVKIWRSIGNLLEVGTGFYPSHQDLPAWLPRRLQRLLARLAYSGVFILALMFVGVVIFNRVEKNFFDTV